MKLTLMSVVGLLALAGPLAAQQPAPSRPMPDTAAPALRRQIEANFRAVAKEELGLNDQQADRVFAIQMNSNRRRHDLENETKLLNAALAAQLRPGVAADPAAVTRLLDSVGVLRLAEGRTFADEQRELATFLTPVQRGQLYRLQGRLYARLGERLERRRERAAERRRP